jgi:Spy/CpxP family protein refolding chaperone
MKKHLVLAATIFLAILVSVPCAMAQKKGKASGGSSSRVDAQLATLTTQLGLTDDEKAKIQPILSDEVAKIHEVKKDSTLSKDDQKAKNKVIRDSANQQIRALLTPDQQKTFDSISKKGHGKKDKSATAAVPAASL